MGYGDYSHEAHEAITRARAGRPAQEVFKQRSCHALMNPKGVRSRESRDTAEHPESLAIAFALDVTGSMGDIPRLLATQELPKFMRLLEVCKVRDPQVLFCAVGDAISDQAPLQVGQFETTAELMDQWLTWSWIEGGGGPGIQESYELALYFLAEHTEMDCLLKRDQRGYAFITGDEHPFPAVSRHQVEAIIGEQVDADLPTEAVVAALTQSYHPFFLIPDASRASRCERRWRDLLGDQTIVMEGPEMTCHVAAGLVALTEGVIKNLDELADLLLTERVDKKRVNAVVRAIGPYAATLSASGAPMPKMTAAALPGESRSSFWKRLLGG